MSLSFQLCLRLPDTDVHSVVISAWPDFAESVCTTANTVQTADTARPKYQVLADMINSVDTFYNACLLVKDSNILSSEASRAHEGYRACLNFHATHPPQRINPDISWRQDPRPFSSGQNANSIRSKQILSHWQMGFKLKQQHLLEEAEMLLQAAPECYKAAVQAIQQVGDDTGILQMGSRYRKGVDTHLTSSSRLSYAKLRLGRSTCEHLVEAELMVLREWSWQFLTSSG